MRSLSPFRSVIVRALGSNETNVRISLGRSQNGWEAGASSALVSQRTVGQLQGSRHVLLQPRCEKRKFPLFVLNESDGINYRADPVLRAYRSIVDCAAVRYEIVIDLDVAVAELDRVLRRQPIAAPCLNSRTVAARPISHQEPPVGVEIAVVVVPINGAPWNICSHRVGQRRFHAKIQF